MIDYTHRHKKHDENSISSNDSSTLKTVWNRLSHLFHSPEDSNRRLSTSSSESDSSRRSAEIGSTCKNSTRHHRANHRKKRINHHDDYSDSLIQQQQPQHLVIPPFSPTYCKANEFPYSNFYVKLPNGKWMIRYRSGNRDILGTDEFEGYMI